MTPRRLRPAAARLALLGVAVASIAAGAAEPDVRESRLRGVVSRVDGESRSFTLRDDAEMETTVWWTGETKIVDPRGASVDGEKIRVDGRVEATCLEQSGKWHATHVRLLD